MAAIPPFENVAIVADKPALVAEISSLFTRPRRYLPVLDGPRMTRPDWGNEVIRCSKALWMVQSRRMLLAGLSAAQIQRLSENWPEGAFTLVGSTEEAEAALKGLAKGPSEGITWGDDNLGVGLLLARRSKKRLQIADGASPRTNFVSGGFHLLIACEMGYELAQIASSNLAFSMDAAFLVIPKLPDEERNAWLQEIYALGLRGDVSSQFAIICSRVRQKLPNFEFEKFRQILFVTNGFPWGIAVPECATTHMFSYPDFGRSIVEGMWTSHQPSRSAKTALLIDPQQVAGSEIEHIAKSLRGNGTYVRIEAGPRATVSRVYMLVETMPFDIIVLATHAGDVSGERVTYEFEDSEGVPRRLIVDEAVGFGFDPKTDKVLVQEFNRFHELDGISWTDSEAKKNLRAGTAIKSWANFEDKLERDKFKVHSEPLPRVIGSMALRMHDDIWIPMVQGFSPSCSPVIVNNACSSWHELSDRLTFAGARAYIGTLFPVTDGEAQAVGSSIFRQQLGKYLPNALQVSQNTVYGTQGRRPYAMVGLPFCSIQRNTINPIAYLAMEYKKAIDEYGRMEKESSIPGIRENARRYKEFLSGDFQDFAHRVRL